MIGAITAGLLSVAGAPAPTSSYESIATVSIGSGGAANATFSSIPSTYKHLQIRQIAQCATAATWIAIQFNSDTGTNYTWHELRGDGASASAAGGGGLAYIRIALQDAGSYWSSAVTDILDYQNTNKYKTTRSLHGVDRNGGGVVGLTSGFWANTAGVSSITIYPQGGGNFNQYSQFALYGIKG